MRLKFGIDLKGHKSKPVIYGAKTTDVLVVMESWQVGFLKKNLIRQNQYRLLELRSKSILSYRQDPYGASAAYFDKCFASIMSGVESLAKSIRK